MCLESMFYMPNLEQIHQIFAGALPPAPPPGLRPGPTGPLAGPGPTPKFFAAFGRGGHSIPQLGRHPTRLHLCCYLKWSVGLYTKSGLSDHVTIDCRITTVYGLDWRSQFTAGGENANPVCD